MDEQEETAAPLTMEAAMEKIMEEMMSSIRISCAMAIQEGASQPEVELMVKQLNTMADVLVDQAKSTREFAKQIHEQSNKEGK